ncbi:Aldo/keto reductase [Cristinia sonorae]|uniref:Aldo/keto reductase n=1 Tax=Cristinia sonorae TaxID=1940300 RepID=A0A8K0UXP2_9AGAR|nr:Aldo/keto reductase [Cristinia sonorae]
MATQKIIYGTAWKEVRTTALVVSAVLNGFRAIDTACQPKHYREDLVGEAIQILRDKHGFRREDLYLQTKYTPIGGQDRTKPLPYDPSSKLDVQIRTSFQKSLENLGTTYLDCLLLHSPLDSLPRTILAWRTLMALQDEGKVKHIGISNVYDVDVLETLHRDAGRMVEVVQNRWYERNNWDHTVVAYCKQNNIQYQSFWTLTGSPKLLANPAVLGLAERLTCTPAQIVYAIAQAGGIVPISGTTNEEHMREDVAVDSLAFDEEAKTQVASLVSTVFRQ